MQHPAQEERRSAGSPAARSDAIHVRIRTFMREAFLVDDFADDESFLASGIIDSLGMMQIITFLEQEYGIFVEESELRPENLDSVDQVAAFIARKRAPPGRATDGRPGGPSLRAVVEEREAEGEDGISIGETPIDEGSRPLPG